MDRETIGFIGLGIMGKPMARHLLDAYRLVVYDHHPSNVEWLTALGAEGATSSKDVAGHSDVVISMVPDSPNVEDVYLSDDGVLAGARPGALLIDMSTISPVTAIRVAGAAVEKGCTMLDAPVSGGDLGAHEGTLSIMVGGEPDVFERARPVLELLGSPILCGPSGAGQTVKACNQIQVALNFIGMAEALVLGAKAGVDPAIVVKVLRSRFHYKDLDIIRETAKAFGASLPASALAHELFSAMLANGWGDLDHSAVIKVVELLSNVEARSSRGENAGA